MRKMTLQDHIRESTAKSGTCVLWTGYVHPNGGAPVAGMYGKPVLLRGAVWDASGRKRPSKRGRHSGIMLLCGERRCLNVEHMKIGPHGTRQGRAYAKKRKQITALYLKGLKLRQEANKYLPVRLAERFELSRERIRQILVMELERPDGKSLKAWALESRVNSTDK